MRAKEVSLVRELEIGKKKINEHTIIDTRPISVWISFFLTSFSENLAVGRICLCRESEYY
jgi:hypothetical protein